MVKPIIYQMFPRIWGNSSSVNKKNGTLSENGSGKFSDIDKETLGILKCLGCTHVWVQGVIRHSPDEHWNG